MLHGAARLYRASKENESFGFFEFLSINVDFKPGRLA